MFLFMSSLDTVLWRQELMLMKQETKYSKGHWPPSSESRLCMYAACILVRGVPYAKDTGAHL